MNSSETMNAYVDGMDQAKYKLPCPVTASDSTSSAEQVMKDIQEQWTRMYVICMYVRTYILCTYLHSILCTCVLRTYVVHTYMYILCTYVRTYEWTLQYPFYGSTSESSGSPIQWWNFTTVAEFQEYSAGLFKKYYLRK